MSATREKSHGYSSDRDHDRKLGSRWHYAARGMGDAVVTALTVLLFGLGLIAAAFVLALILMFATVMEALDGHQ